MQQKSVIKEVTQVFTGALTIPFNIPPGNYTELMVRISGTTTTAQALALDEIGSYRLVRGGRQIQGETCEFLSDWADLYGGFIEATTATAGENAYLLPIRMSLPGLPNSLRAIGSDELVLYLDFSADMFTAFASNAVTITVMGVQDESVQETYELQVASRNQVIGGAAETPFDLNTPNLAVCVIRNNASVSFLQLETDKRTVQERISLAALKALVETMVLLESSGNELIPIYTAESGERRRFINKTSSLRITTTGATTVEITTLSLNRSPDFAVAQSRVEAANARQLEQAASVTLFGN